VCLISQTTWAHLEFDGQFMCSTVGRPQTKRHSRRPNYHACPMTIYRGLPVSLTVLHPDPEPPKQPHTPLDLPTLLNSNWVKCFNGRAAGENSVLPRKSISSKATAQEQCHRLLFLPHIDMQRICPKTSQQ